MQCLCLGETVNGSDGFTRCAECATVIARWRNVPAERREREAANLRATVRRALLAGAADPFEGA
jgi:hypothetical protein